MCSTLFTSSKPMWVVIDGGRACSMIAAWGGGSTVSSARVGTVGAGTCGQGVTRQGEAARRGAARRTVNVFDEHGDQARHVLHHVQKCLRVLVLEPGECAEEVRKPGGGGRSAEVHAAAGAVGGGRPTSMRYRYLFLPYMCISLIISGRRRRNMSGCPARVTSRQVCAPRHRGGNGREGEQHGTTGPAQYA